jgi:23S rRNA (uracil1939-C5)-methyltransferase
MRRRGPKLPAGEFRLHVDDVAHDGRGVGRRDGKAVFVEGALAGEDVDFRYVFCRKSFDEGVAVRVHQAAPARVEPPCAHAGTCGGCSLQHMAPDAQIALKQRVLLDQLLHFGKLAPAEVFPPLVGDRLGYRGKARLAVRWVAGKNRVLAGFREKRSSFIADLDRCLVLQPALGERLDSLKTLLSGLAARERIPQVEFAAGDEERALVLRHLDPLADSDREALLHWCRAEGFQLWLQPGNESTVHRAWPPEGEERLTYRHPAFGVELGFHPMDFTQVNASVNRAMVQRAVDLLAPGAQDRVLDLFCGLGNFTLPLATRAAQVTGVEGSAAMVERGYENARRNGRGNLRFFAANLDEDCSGASWAREKYDLLLIDPPRSGAGQIAAGIDRYGARRIVYVSCNPATLARDAGLIAARGYRLAGAGVMDMFPHTAHVESIALFERA